MRGDDVLDRHDLVGLAGLVSNRELSPAELLDAVVARIEQRNPVVNALTATRIDEARSEVAAGLPHGPLRGVPFAVKGPSRTALFGIVSRRLAAG